MTGTGPRCYTGFDGDTSACPDFHMDLVDDLSEKPEHSSSSMGEEDLVCVGSAPNEVVASIWLQILEESGIRAVAQSGRPMSGLLGDFSFNVPSEVYVLESQADRAAEILESLVEDEHIAPPEEQDPFCQE